MKIKNILSSALLGTLALSSCGSDDEMPLAGGGDVEISATIGSVTRTSPYLKGDASDTFSAGDVIHISSGIQSADYVYENGSWTAAPGNEKIKWMEKQMQISAVYPASANASDFVLPSDQGTAAASASADYMTYSGIHHRSDGTVSIAMQRRTARVVVNPYFANDLSGTGAEIKSVTIHADVTPGDVETIVPIKPFAHEGSYTALVAPTSDYTAANRDFLDIVVLMPDGSEKTYYLSGIHSLDEGMSYSLSLKIGWNVVGIEQLTMLPWVDETDTDHNNLYPQFSPLQLQQAGTLTREMLNEHLGSSGEIKIEGPMNGSDIRVLREFMGCKYYTSQPSSISPINYLDLGGVNIVSGGDVYAEDPFWGDFTVNKNDIIPGHMFNGLKSESPMHIVLPRETRFIEGNAFRQASVISIDMPETLEEIYSLAFANSSIEEIKIPGRVTNIVGNAFEGCTNLKRFEISEGVTSIDISTIVQDLKLEYLYLPYSLNGFLSLSIAADNLKTLRIMTKPDVMKDEDFTLTKGGSNITGQHIDCDLYLCNERQGEVTNGSSWAGNTWKSITFVDCTTLK